MPRMNMLQAVNSALRCELQHNPSVIIFGEDVGKFGGVFRATANLQKEFGEHRVFDTPLSENGIVGAAVGMAIYGLRPVPEIQFADFIYPAFDQIVNEVAKLRYRSGGQMACSMVIRMPYGGGIRGGHYHSQSPEAYFAHTPGLKVVIPSTPYDAKGLLTAAIRDDNPVLFMEPKKLYRSAQGEVPEKSFEVPLGKAKIMREGDDFTLICYGSMVPISLEAADKAEEEGVSIEVIDLRTLIPYDLKTLLQSVKKTGRVIVTHEAPKTCGFGAELAATITEKALLHLESPVYRVTGFDTPFPYVHEEEYLPTSTRILKAVQASLLF